MTNEANRVLKHLSGMKFAHATLTTKDLRGLLLETGGEIFKHGHLRTIRTKSLGAGVHRVDLLPLED